MNYGLVKFNSATDTKKVIMAKNVYCVDLIVYFEGEEKTNYYELDELENAIKGKKKIPKTSQPATGAILDKLNEALQHHDYVFVITPSKLLSGTHQNTLLAVEMLDESDKKRIKVVENQSFGISEYLTNDLALFLFERDLEPEIIEQQLCKLINSMSYYGCIGNVEHLSQGGRFDVSKYSYSQIRRMNVLIYQHNLKKGVVNISKGSKQTLEHIEEIIINKKPSKLYFLSIREKKGYRMEIKNICMSHKIEFYDCGEAKPLVAAQMGIGSFIFGLQE